MGDSASDIDTLPVLLSLRVPIYAQAMCPYPSEVHTDKPYSDDT